MEYTHIKDCWNAISEISEAGELTIEKLNNLFDNFPRWSGDWTIHYVDENNVEVENFYYDEQYESYESKSEIFIINFTQDELEEFEEADL